jgi:hypothetical protein
MFLDIGLDNFVDMSDPGTVPPPPDDIRPGLARTRGRAAQSLNDPVPKGDSYSGMPQYGYGYPR